MADLTEEEKIVIGVCTAIAALILIGIIIFICCVVYRRRRTDYHRYRKDRYIKERVIGDNRYDDRYDRFYGGEVREFKKMPPPYDPIPEPLPPPLPLPPPPPREPRTRWEMYDSYREPTYIHQEPAYVPVHKTYARESRREREYINPPIVIPIREPEYISSPPAEPETLYLKFRDDQALMHYREERPVTRYHDDQALIYRRPETRVIRRTRSFSGPQKRSNYVGEWGHSIFQPWEMPFNERAARSGKDPFLWQ